MLKFNLTEEEFNSIAEKYRSDDNMFKYAEFCNTINLAFTQRGIDKNPNASVKPVSENDTFLARRKYLEITEDEV